MAWYKNKEGNEKIPLIFDIPTYACYSFESKDLIDFSKVGYL